MYFSEGYSPADFEEASKNNIVKSNESSFNNSSEVSSIERDSEKCKHEDINSISTVYSAGAEKVVSQNDRNWAELPSLVVIKIYSFLRRPDRSRMSLVCSRWAEEFSYPSLWKAMKFFVPANSSSPDIYPEIKFVRKYGSMLRHVEILGYTEFPCPVPVLWRKLKLFLQALESSSQLVYIKFYEMVFFFRLFNSNGIHEDLIRTLISFFKSQNNLETVDFNSSCLCKEDGVELLKAVFHSDSNTIKHLGLRGFLSKDRINLGAMGVLIEKSSLIVSPQYMSNLSRICFQIARVQLIEWEYTVMFEHLINCMYEKHISGECQLDDNKPNKSSLEISFIYETPWNFNGTPPETWKYLINAFPTIKRKMHASITLRNYFK